VDVLRSVRSKKSRVSRNSGTNPVIPFGVASGLKIIGSVKVTRNTANAVQSGVVRQQVPVFPLSIK